MSFRDKTVGPAVERLAALFEFGALDLATAPGKLFNDACDEIERLRKDLSFMSRGDAASVYYEELCQARGAMKSAYDSGAADEREKWEAWVKAAEEHLGHSLNLPGAGT